jgi:hypothetical protein
MIASRNFVSEGDQDPHVEIVPFNQNLTGGIVNTDGSFTKTASADWINGHVYANRALHYGDGYVSLMPNTPGTFHQMFGFTNKSTFTALSDFNYGLLVHTVGGGTIYYQEGATQASTGLTAIAGDELRISIESGQVIYKRIRGGTTTVLRTVAAPTLLYPLNVVGTIYEPGYTMPALTLYGVLASTLGSPVFWKNKVAVSLDANDNISSTYAIDSWGQSGASSVESIPEDWDGRVTFVANETNRERVIGLSTTDTNQHYTSIGWGIFLTSTGTVIVMESGSNRGTFGSYVTGDILSVGRENGVIIYRKNGANFYPSAVSSNDAQLFVDVAFNGRNGIGASANTVRLFKAGASQQGWQNSPDGQVEAKRLKVATTTLDAMRLRVMGALNDQRQYVGRDYGPVAVHKLNASMFRLGNVRTDDEDTYTELIVDIPKTVLDDPYANFDSVERIRVRVYNVFGDPIADMEQAFDKRGKVVIGFHPRYLADPYEFAVFSIEFANAWDFSTPVWWTASSYWNNYWNWLTAQNGTATKPVWRRRTDFPSNLTATAVSDTEVQLTWKASTTNQSGNSFFGIYKRLYQTVAPKPLPTLVASLAQSVEAYKVTGLSPNTKYEFVAHGGGNAEWSNFAIVTTLPAPSAVATNLPPSGLTATEKSQTVVDLIWTRNSTTNTGVEVYRDGVLAATLGAAVVTWQDTGRTAGTKYIYKVRNVFAGPTYSNYSNEDDATTFVNPPASSTDPTNLQLSLGSDGKTVSLTWNANGGSNASVYRSTDGVTWGGAIATGQTNSYTDSTTAYETHYYYRVFNVTGGVNYSNVQDMWTTTPFVDEPERPGREFTIS